MSPGVSPAPPPRGWGKPLANRERTKGFEGLGRDGFSSDLQEVGVRCLTVKRGGGGYVKGTQLVIKDHMFCGRKDQNASRLLSFFLL